MRQETLANLMEEVKAEIGTEASSGSDDDGIRQALKRTQRMWWLEFRPAFLDIRVLVEVVAGTQFVSMPENISYEGIKKLYLQFGEYYYEMNQGISVDDYSYRDSFADERDYPVFSWQRHNREVVGDNDERTIEDGIELHPIPSTDVNIVFDATRNLYPFEEDTDKSTLDGTALALSVAGELLIRANQNDGHLKRTRAKKMMAGFNRRNADGRTLSFNRGGQRVTIPKSHLVYLHPPRR